MIKLPVKDRTTIPWMSPHEIPAIKLVLSAWRKMRRNNPAECDSIRKYIAECSTPWNVVDIEADHAAYYLEKLTAIDERIRKETKNAKAKA